MTHGLFGMNSRSGYWEASLRWTAMKLCAALSFWDHIQENTQIGKNYSCPARSVHWVSLETNNSFLISPFTCYDSLWRHVAPIYCYLMYPLQWCVHGHAHIQTKSHTETSRTGNETCNVAHTFSTWEGTFRGLVPNVKSPCLRRTNECKSTHLESYPRSL